MITIKITEYVPYSTTIHKVEERIDKDSLYDLRANQGEVLTLIVKRLQESVDLQVEATMKREGIILDENGTRIPS